VVVGGGAQGFNDCPTVTRCARHLPEPSSGRNKESLAALSLPKEHDMGATTIGGLIGAAIDSMGGDGDSNVDGAVKGAIVANVLKVVVPVAVTYAVGWAVLRGLGELKDKVVGE
jgi:hypothetical protein